MPSRKDALVDKSLEPLILVLRNQRVILDADLARLYGVTTKAFNQAVKRNADRFPEDFAFQLTIQEVAQLRSQAVTSNMELIDTQREDQYRSQFVTGSQKHRDPRLRPWAFTEHGAVMVANILWSE
jgi:ORF6N domain-containing protein